MEYYSGFKKIEIWGKWMETIILSEVTQTQEDKDVSFEYSDVCFIWNAHRGQGIIQSYGSK